MQNNNTKRDNERRYNILGNNAPKDNTARDNTPRDNTPKDNTARDNTPMDNTPMDNTPRNNTPRDNTTRDNTTRDNASKDNTSRNNSQSNSRKIDNANKKFNAVWGKQRLPFSTVLDNLKENKVTRGEYVLRILERLQAANLHAAHDKWTEECLKDRMRNWKQEISSGHHVRKVQVEKEDEIITFAYQFCYVVKKIQETGGKIR